MRKPYLRTAIMALCFLFFFQNAYSSTEENSLNSYKFIGKGSLKVFVWDIYDVQLFSSKKPFSKKNSLILFFDYKRNLSKQKIIKRSLLEIERQNVADENTILRWASFLDSCIKSAQEGSKPYVHWKSEGIITFFYGNTETCSVVDKQFSRAFIDIWLGETTSRPELRKELLGINK